MQNPLRVFIDHARAKNIDLATVRMLLLSAGWKEKDVAAALVEQVLDIPVPTPPDVGGAREGFMHLLSFACLFSALGSAIALFFQYFNRALPDASQAQYFYSSTASLDGVRWGLAILVVTFPIFWFVTRKLVSEIRLVPERSRSPIRRWLTYITLLVTALMIVGDLSTLIYYFLDGEISTRFLLKVITLFALSGMTFLYFLFTLRFPEPSPRLGSVQVTKIMEFLSWFVVLAAIVWGAVLIGTPQTQRALRFDDLRIQHFKSIAQELSSYVYEGKAYDTAAKPTRAAPATLQELASNAAYQKLDLQDPLTKVPYMYSVSSPTKVSLCGTFALVRDQQYDILWNHPAGEHCFELDLLRTRNF
jgi:Domain of unknown function (DUF5671)